jgi:hypothetical protein
MMVVATDLSAIWWDTNGTSVSRDAPFAPVRRQAASDCIGNNGVSAKREKTEREKAILIRTMWMREMGFDEHAISQACYGDDPPVSVDTELTELAAAMRLRVTFPATREMESWSTRY